LLIQNRLIIISLCILMASMAVTCEASRSVRDPVGRQMQIAGNPRRIIALAPSITEILFALGQSGRLVGVTQFSDYPIEACQLPKVGSYVKLDIEKIVALKPDICIAIKDGNPKGTIMRIEALNIPVFAVNPTNLETVIETIMAVGELLGVQQQAKSLVQAMRLRIRDIARRVDGVPVRPRVFLQIGVAPIVSAGTDTFIDELIRKAGGRNIAEGTASYPRFNTEDIIRLQPDIIIITSMARGVTFETVKAGWMCWKSIPAVINRRIHIADSDLLNRPSPRLVDGLEKMAHLIHPELFEPGSEKESE